MKILYFDCFSGVAGDMLLGALIDAGVPLDDVRAALGGLAIDRETIWIERVTRAGVSATKLHVRGERVPHEHSLSPAASAPLARPGASHHHHPGDHSPTLASASASATASADSPSHLRTLAAPSHPHVHRSLLEIEQLIDGSALSGSGKGRAKALFGRLAAAEAQVHGVSIDRVHLHEVGALDSIIDIVGSVFALESLGIGRFVSSPLNVGSGTVHSSHGLYPVPAPATALLLTGAPIYAGPQQVELVTPTGALLVTGYAAGYGPTPPMRLEKIGYGAGDRDPKDTPNVLRVLVGESDATAPTHTVVVLEAEIDDMNPQIFGAVMDRLLAAGALDVFYTPIQMKKNRPGTLLSIIATPDARERLSAIVFRETTTIGIRYREMSRECLDRETLTVPTPFGQVRIKVARRHGELFNASPEFDDCVRLAADTGRPIKEVQAAAMKAFLDSGQ